MKSYDIFVDRRLIQGDLIVVDLPLRNDIAVYDYIEIDSKVNKIAGEKSFSPENAITANSYLFPADKGVVSHKFERADAAFSIDAIAGSAIFAIINTNENKILVEPKLQEVIQKIEKAFSSLDIGVDGTDAFTTAKTVGSVGNTLEVAASMKIYKHSYPIIRDEQSAIAIGVLLSSPLAAYYESANNGLATGASVKSLSRLVYATVLRNETNIGVVPFDLEISNSLGKGRLPVAIGAEASTAVEFFESVNSGVNISIFGIPTLHIPFGILENGFLLNCSSVAVLRRYRTLSETDELGTLADIDNMTLDDLYYVTIEE